MRAGFRVAIALPLLALGATAYAAPASITFTYEHHIVTESVVAHPEWKRPTREWFYQGVPAVPPAEFKSCGTGTVVDPGWTSVQTTDWDENAILQTIREEVASKIDRDAGHVVISRNASGSIVFDGIGLTGRHVDAEAAATLAVQALKDNVDMVILPVTITQPKIDVRDQKLIDQGIREVVTVGESVFAKSPMNRRHNIAVGMAKFNGHLIPQGSVFSFDEVLGKVDATTGYWKELVIQGDTTIPDYGGGLCQVSSTAYRGPWEYGLPIVQRKNHSYAVSYYSPQGTDATIYPPKVDMKFLNDTPAALLIQTYLDDQDHAYFIYYGMHDDRKSEVFGPFLSNFRPASREEKTIYTTDIPPGDKRKAGERHDGLDAVWYRQVTKAGTGTTFERYFSSYEARQVTWQVGVTPEEMQRLTAGALSATPSSEPTSD